MSGSTVSQGLEFDPRCHITWAWWDLPVIPNPGVRDRRMVDSMSSSAAFSAQFYTKPQFIPKHGGEAVVCRAQRRPVD